MLQGRADPGAGPATAAALHVHVGKARTQPAAARHAHTRARASALASASRGSAAPAAPSAGARLPVAVPPAGKQHGTQNPRTRKTAAEAEEDAAGRQAAHLLPHRPRRSGPRRAASAAVAAGRVAQDAAVAVGLAGAAAHLGLI